MHYFLQHTSKRPQNSIKTAYNNNNNKERQRKVQLRLQTIKNKSIPHEQKVSIDNMDNQIKNQPYLGSYIQQNRLVSFNVMDQTGDFFNNRNIQNFNNNLSLNHQNININQSRIHNKPRSQSSISQKNRTNNSQRINRSLKSSHQNFDDELPQLIHPSVIKMNSVQIYGLQSPKFNQKYKKVSIHDSINQKLSSNSNNNFKQITNKDNLSINKSNLDANKKSHESINKKFNLNINQNTQKLNEYRRSQDFTFKKGDRLIQKNFTVINEPKNFNIGSKYHISEKQSQFINNSKNQYNTINQQNNAQQVLQSGFYNHVYQSDLHYPNNKNYQYKNNFKNNPYQINKNKEFHQQQRVSGSEQYRLNFNQTASINQDLASSSSRRDKLIFPTQQSLQPVMRVSEGILIKENLYLNNNNQYSQVQEVSNSMERELSTSRSRQKGNLMNSQNNMERSFNSQNNIFLSNSNHIINTNINNRNNMNNINNMNKQYQQYKQKQKYQQFLQQQSKQLQQQRSRCEQLISQIDRVIYNTDFDYSQFEEYPHISIEDIKLIKQNQHFNILKYLLNELIQLFIHGQVIKYQLKYRSYEIISKIYSQANKYYKNQQQLIVQDPIRIAVFTYALQGFLPEYSNHQIDIVIKRLFQSKEQLQFNQFLQQFQSILNSKQVMLFEPQSMKKEVDRTLEKTKRLFTIWVEIEYFVDKIKELLREDQYLNQLILFLCSDQHQSDNFDLQLIQKILLQNPKKNHIKHLKIDIFFRHLLTNNLFKKQWIQWFENDQFGQDKQQQQYGLYKNIKGIDMIKQSYYKAQEHAQIDDLGEYYKIHYKNYLKYNDKNQIIIDKKDKTKKYRNTILKNNQNTTNNKRDIKSNKNINDNINSNINNLSAQQIQRIKQNQLKQRWYVQRNSINNTNEVNYTKNINQNYNCINSNSYNFNNIHSKGNSNSIMSKKVNEKRLNNKIVKFKQDQIISLTLQPNLKGLNRYNSPIEFLHEISKLVNK